MARKPTGRPNGRPKIEINNEQFKKLCELHCTKEEIAGFFSCTEDTIENYCKREYRESFSVVFKRLSVGGKMSLRRYQFDLAKHNASMAIFLGKQMLGQRDDIASLERKENSNEKSALNTVVETLKEIAKKDG
jgi:precorrin-4 methylase